MKMYVWRKHILHNYRDGIVVALADNVEQARTMALDKVYKSEIEPNLIGDGHDFDDPQDWPYCTWLKFQKAIAQEPEVYDSPSVVYMQGSE